MYTTIILTPLRDTMMTFPLSLTQQLLYYVPFHFNTGNLYNVGLNIRC